MLPPSDIPDTRRDQTARMALLALATMLILIADLAVAASRSAPGVGQSPEALPTDVEAPGPVSPGDAAEARADAGCELLVDGQPLTNRDHLDPEDAPPADALYPGVRPANSGQHLSAVLDVQSRLPKAPIDERAVLHNMEHGSVVVWFAPNLVTGPEQARIERWMRERLALGFTSDVRGAVFASPTDDITSGKAVALRAWGFALDCDRFDVTVADRFLQDHWGSHGDSPEAHLSPFPAGVLGGQGVAV